MSQVMNLSKNTIALLKGFVIYEPSKALNRQAAATVQAHLMQLGYMLDNKAFNAVQASSLEWINCFHDEVITFLRSSLGGDRNYTALYKNFPQEVMSLSDTELYINAFFHYLSNGTWEPSTVDFQKPIKFENVKYRLLTEGSNDTFSNIFTSLLKVNTSLTPQDQAIVSWFIQNEKELIFPSQIPFKENLVSVIAQMINSSRSAHELRNVKLTPTDVLRVAVGLSGGDVSLPAVPIKLIQENKWFKNKVVNPLRKSFEFKKFSRPERKMILSLLENTSCDVQEMVLKASRWIRLGEVLHPGDYTKQFPKAFKAFQKIRNDDVKSWYSDVERAFVSSFEEGLSLLSTRPGEFVRRLDALVRKNPSHLNLIFNYLALSVDKSSNKVLFETLNHFLTRNKKVTNRSVMVKGARNYTPLPNLPILDEKTISFIESKILLAIENKISRLEPLGSVYIDPKLMKIPLPTNMRSMNVSLKPVIRGQRTSFGNPDAKVIRPFVHWFDRNGNEDLDLSVTFVGNTKYDTLDYCNLRVAGSVHSGDVRHRRGACAEYVDIVIDKAIKNGFSYALVDVRNFNGRPMSSINASFGFMERQFPESNNTWLPETVTSVQQLESTSTNILLAILDFQAREYIYLDMNSDGSVMARHDTNTLLQVIEHYAELPNLSVYHLLEMHAKRRGTKVDAIQDATTVYKFEDFTSSYEKIAELMGI